MDTKMSNTTGASLIRCADEYLVDESYDRLIADVKSLAPDFPTIQDDDELEKILYFFFDFGIFVKAVPNDDGNLVVPYERSINRLNDILIYTTVRAVPIGKDFEIVRTR